MDTVNTMGIESRLGLFLDELENNQVTLDVNSLSQLTREFGINAHLAILNQPYLNKMVSGEKSIESRFSRMRTPPFHQVRAGDILILKVSSGPILAVALVSDVEFFGPLAPGQAEELMIRYRDQLALEDTFIAQKQDSSYATLIHLDAVCPINPMQMEKTDRRSWVVLNHGLQQRLF